MARSRIGWAAAGMALIAMVLAHTARATTLDVLIASNGTVTQGDLVFSNFTANILGGALTAANVDVAAIVTASGASGLRFTGVPTGAFSESTTGGGGARETIVDVGFTVTVNGTSFRIHGVQQALDPAAVATNNAKINDQTTIPPSGTPIASLFSCIEGTGVPAGQTCTTPIDSAVLNADASSLIVDRQIQIIVGQKGGATTGNASTGFFDISFSEAAVTCPPLTAVNIAAVGATTLCAGATGGTATVTNTGGGISSEQWGYRTTTGGAITAIPGQTGSSYVIHAADFAGAGSFLLVCTTTPTCGTPTVSNELAVTINPTPAPPLAMNNGPVCVGGTLQLTASFVSGATYQWTGPNGFTSLSQLPTISPVTAAAAGTYSVTVTLAGCPSAPATTVVVVNPQPALPVITAPASVSPASTFTASVTANAGSTYAWSVLGGTLVSGNGTAQVSVTAGAAGTVTIQVIETNASGCASAQASHLVPIAGGTFFFTLTPCRLVDTRTAGGALAAGEARVFSVAGVCGVPATAKALSVNLTAVPLQTGQLTLYPGDQPVPGTNTLSFRAGINRAVNSVMGMGANGTLGVINLSPATTDVIIDVNGFFQ